MKRALALVLLLAACREEAAAPPEPAPLTAEAVSHFCQMNVLEHPGPKGQIHLEGLPAPLFFAQVRDAIAYLKGPERDAPITAVYVSDMGAAPSWHSPGSENWVDARAAVFVVGAGVRGGMGAPEVVPFAARADAEGFVARYGGEILSLDAISDAAVLGPVDIDTNLEVPS